MTDWNENDVDPKEFVRRNGRALFLGACVFLAALVLWSCVVFIPAGHEGVLFNKLSGKVSATTLKQGWQLRVPVITNVVVYDCRRKAYTMSMTTVDSEREGANTNWSPTADGNAVGIDITVWYRIPQDTAGKVYLKLGNQQWCEEQVIRPIIRNAVRLTVAKYTAPELYGPKRTEVQDKIKELIDKSFRDDSFFVLDGDGVFLRDVHLTASYQRSIEEKVAAQQTIQRKQFEVEQAKQEALAIKIKNDALASAKSYLQLRTIEMLEKKDFKVMVVPQSQGLILNLQENK